MTRSRKLLSIGHSYVVALNRRLAHEMARAGRGTWEVTAVAPTYFHGSRDLRPVRLESSGQEPCPVVGIPAYATSWVHLFLYGPQLRRLLSDRWDLVHCWEEPFVMAGCQIACWTPRRARLVYATFQNLKKTYPPPFCWMERWAMARASGWIPFGQTIAATLKDRPGYRGKPSRLIPPGVDVQQFRPDPAAGAAVRRSLGWTPVGPPVVGFLGRFLTEKGLKLLTRVLESLNSPWRALLVGSGPLEAELRAWAARHGDQVRLCTGVKHDEVPPHLNAMDLLCAPSQTGAAWREQFGRMLIEAFACGVPVLGSDSGEIPHVIGDAGLVLREKDEAAWSRTLEILLADPAYRRELAARGQERAHSLYAWPVVARRHLDFFAELLEGRGREE